MGRNELKMHYLKFHELTIDRWIDRLVFKGASTSMVIGTPDIVSRANYPSCKLLRLENLISIVISSQVLFTMEVYYTESSIHNS
jgi:hypothetical protein